MPAAGDFHVRYRWLLSSIFLYAVLCMYRPRKMHTNRSNRFRARFAANMARQVIEQPSIRWRARGFLANMRRQASEQPKHSMARAIFSAVAMQSDATTRVMSLDVCGGCARSAHICLALQYRMLPKICWKTMPPVDLSNEPPICIMPDA